jgi:hypothetical protein
MSNIITAGNATNNGTSISSDTSGVLELKTGSTPTTAITIDASQNVGIGTSSPGARLDVRTTSSTQATFTRTGQSAVCTLYQSSADTYLSATNSGASLILATQDTERARIDSSGNLLVNNGSVYFTSAQYRSNVASSQLQFINNSAGVSLAVNGTSWGSLSDERDKEIIEPITNAVDKVSSLRSIIGRYKSDDAEKRRAFLIAQDVKAVLPEAVTELEDEKQTLVLQYTETIPLLVAAIQELKAELDATKAEVAALKGA